MWTSPLVVSLIGVMVAIQVACAQQKPTERQIAEAVSTLPAQMREAAAVLGYRRADRLVTLREGTNGMVCLADHPGDDEFHVACYHESLEPFMARGRELRTQGMNDAEVTRIRSEEIEAGRLAMPDHPAALYSLTGGTFNAQTGEVDGARGLDVLYMPYATQESTGIPETASRERPWLMFPGTPWAHVMISR